MKHLPRASFLVIVTLLIAACGSSQAIVPAPTPEIIVKTVEIPGPQPTPQIIEQTVTVPVASQACLDALDYADQTSIGLLNTISALLDGKPKKAEKEWGTVSGSIDEYISLAAQCRGQAANTSY